MLLRNIAYMADGTNLVTWMQMLAFPFVSKQIYVAYVRHRVLLRHRVRLYIQLLLQERSNVMACHYFDDFEFILLVYEVKWSGG